jgi:hypothetical protein
MEQSAVTVTLTPAEWRLIAGLRDIPESPLKAELGEVIDLAMALVRDPKCAQVQGDGVPCGSATADCESCERITGTLETIKRKLSSL